MHRNSSVVYFIFILCYGSTLTTCQTKKKTFNSFFSHFKVEFCSSSKGKNVTMHKIKPKKPKFKIQFYSINSFSWWSILHDTWLVTKEQNVYRFLFMSWHKLIAESNDLSALLPNFACVDSFSFCWLVFELKQSCAWKPAELIQTLIESAKFSVSELSPVWIELNILYITRIVFSLFLFDWNWARNRQQFIIWHETKKELEKVKTAETTMVRPKTRVLVALYICLCMLLRYYYLWSNFGRIEMKRQRDERSA